MDGSVIAALAGVGMGFIACTATCVVCRIFRRTRYYKKVQHSLEEEERAFQARLAMKHAGDESSLDPADQERLEMVENYLTSIGGECGIGQDGTDASTDPHMPKGVDDVDAFMKELVRPPRPLEPDPHGCPSCCNSPLECHLLSLPLLASVSLRQRRRRAVLRRSLRCRRRQRVRYSYVWAGTAGGPPAVEFLRQRAWPPCLRRLAARLLSGARSMFRVSSVHGKIAYSHRAAFAQPLRLIVAL